MSKVNDLGCCAMFVLEEHVASIFRVKMEMIFQKEM
jgi:hypothetical protein